jgi:hypothetical protein
MDPVPPFTQRRPESVGAIATAPVEPSRRSRSPRPICCRRTAAKAWPIVAQATGRVRASNSQTDPLPRARVGKRIENVVPLSSDDSTSMVPPWAATIRSVM